MRYEFHSCIIAARLAANEYSAAVRDVMTRLPQAATQAIPTAN
jgi:hypothetical protein